MQVYWLNGAVDRLTSELDRRDLMLLGTRSADREKFDADAATTATPTDHTIGRFGPGHAHDTFSGDHNSEEETITNAGAL